MPAAFMLWMACFVGLPLLVGILGGGAVGFFSAGLIVFFGPIVVLILRGGTSHRVDRQRTGIPAFFVAGLFLLVGAASVVVTLTRSVSPFFEYLWLMWFAVGAVFIALGVAVSRSKPSSDARDPSDGSYDRRSGRSDGTK
jgi:peptidoglycan/LPS O-acetylase OafA/YrhL